MTALFECRESLSRRSFLIGSAALSFAALPDLSFGAEVSEGRLLVILLRGGVDALTAMPPIGDPGLKGRRKHLLPDGLLKLDGFFALHPSLKNVHAAFDAGEALLVSGTSLPYTGRSHFEGQDIMESGILKAYASPTGWLGRALDATGYKAVSMALPVPLILRGINPSAESTYPTWISTPPKTVYATLGENWARDPDLAAAGAQLTRATNSGSGMSFLNMGDEPDLRGLARQAATQLARPNGPRVAVLDYVGFDTHAQESDEYSRRLGNVDDAIGAFKQSLGADAWKKTLIVTVTEFGRTVAENGSWGTDHGYGSCAFVVGGALKKGGIVADWPGLKPANLFEGRDLKATIDARSLYGAILSASLSIDPEVVRKDVLDFPKDDRFSPYLG